jgi:hypothetical protein
MTSNYTHFVIKKDFLRVIIYEENGWITGFKMFAVQSFRAPTQLMEDIVDSAYKRITREFNGKDLIAAENALSFAINQGVVDLYEQGKVIINDRYQDITSFSKTDHGVSFPDTVHETNDGYSIFYHGQLPPAMSNLTH